MKFPHGVPMHAIQFLPILAWLLWELGVALPQRSLAVWYASGAAVSFTTFSLQQTFTGRARFDLSLSSGVVLLASAALLIVPAWIGVRGAIRCLLPREPSPRPTPLGFRDRSAIF